jgi:membrane protein YdbS with pleckstrin-like domain
MTNASAVVAQKPKIPLNPNIKILWSLNYLAAFIITFMMFYAFETVTGGWDAFISEFLLQLAFVAIFATFVFFYYIEMKYKGYYYMITDTEIVFRKGIFNTIKTVVPFKEIQNLNIEKSVLERMLGIANLKIETAGSNITESEIIIPGIENEDELSDTVRRKMDELKNGGSTPNSPIVFEHAEEKIAQNHKVEGLERRIMDLESKLDAIARKTEKRDIDIENLKELEESMHAEMRMVHTSIAKLMRSSDETSSSVEKIGKMIARLAAPKKAPGKRKK